MFIEIIVVRVGEICSEVRAAAFAPLPGRLGHKKADGEHVLALPAFGRVEDFVHNVPLPEADYFLGLRERLVGAGDADVSPHKGAQRVPNVGGIQLCAVGMGNLVLYQRVLYVRGAGFCAF